MMMSLKNIKFDEKKVSLVLQTVNRLKRKKKNTESKSHIQRFLYHHGEKMMCTNQFASSLRGATTYLHNQDERNPIWAKRNGNT